MARKKRKKTPGRKPPAHPKSEEIRNLLDQVRKPVGNPDRRPIADTGKKAGRSQTGGSKHLERKGRTKK